VIGPTGSGKTLLAQTLARDEEVITKQAVEGIAPPLHIYPDRSTASNRSSAFAS
jgi:ATP-dependent protease Clp ATPase subunit